MIPPFITLATKTRQLNLYEFTRLNTPVYAGQSSLYSPSSWMHPQFIRGNIDGLCQIKRVEVKSASFTYGYQVSHISPVGTGLSMRVHVNIGTGHGLNFSGLGSGGGNFYGEYSWAKFTSSRSTGLAFTCNPLNGLTGISTAPQIIRTTNLSLDYS